MRSACTPPCQISENINREIECECACVCVRERKREGDREINESDLKKKVYLGDSNRQPQPSRENLEWYP